MIIISNSTNSESQNSDNSFINTKFDRSNPVDGNIIMDDTYELGNEQSD